jgi:GrpB-like predicted nucleotidyltransferase (UPF0157 family)
MIIIGDYDPRWPVVYEAERKRIQEGIGGLALAVEHIGSTAVPGLGAKPIIDIMVGLRGLVDAKECMVPLGDIGYRYVPEYEASIPDRRFFRKYQADGRFHLHMVEIGRDIWNRHLLFRDFLRRNPDEAIRYCELKKELAVKFKTNREAYTEAKTSFIESTIIKARNSVEDDARKIQGS